ncbi:MAG: hypothetical protein AAGF77_05890 [Bacteroidota bacterium]
MRSFLYSFGTHFALLGSSLLTFWVVYQVEFASRLVKKAVIYFCGLYFSIAVYYLLFVFIDTTVSPYPDYVYELAFIATALGAAFATSLLFKYSKKIKIQRQQREVEAKRFEQNALQFIEEVNSSFIKNPS